MSEEQISAAIRDGLTKLGCHVYSVERGRRQGSPGVPDLIVFEPKSRRWTFAELKTEKGRFTRAQSVFRDNALRCGASWTCWRSLDDALSWFNGLC